MPVSPFGPKYRRRFRFFSEKSIFIFRENRRILLSYRREGALRHVRKTRRAAAGLRYHRPQHVLCVQQAGPGDDDGLQFAGGAIPAGLCAAAAAVFALVIPVRINSAKVQPSASVAPVMPLAANNVSFDSGKSTVISGNIDSTVLKSGKSVMARNVSTSSNAAQKAPISFVGNNEVELLRPEFETISIKITLPGIDSVPVTTEVQLPMDVVSGRY